MHDFPTLAQYQSSASYAQIGEYQIAYWTAQDKEAVANDAPWILLIHGFPSAAWDWHYQWQILRQQYRLVCLDLLGLGLSDKPHKHDYSLLEQADIVEKLMAYLDIGQCHILAHDYGDSVAQELLARQHEKRMGLNVKSLCYLNGGLFADHHRPLLTQKLLKSPLGPLVAKCMSLRSFAQQFAKIFGPRSQPEAAHVAILYELLEWKQGKRVLPSLLCYIDERKVHGARWITAMQRTPVAQCFVNGIHDPISGRHMLRQFEKLLPSAQTHGLDVGHYPQLEAPQQVTEYIKHLWRYTADRAITLGCFDKPVWFASFELRILSTFSRVSD